MAQRLIVIDSHPLLYRSYYCKEFRELYTGAASEIEFSMQSTHPRTSSGHLSGGFFGFLRSVKSLRQRQRFLRSQFVFVCDSGRSWRNEVVPKYKHYGEKQPLEGFQEQMVDVQQFLKATGYPVIHEPGLEADDLISVVVTRYLSVGSKHTAIIVSSDQDFFQLVSPQCLLYDDRQKKFYGEAEVEAKTGVPVQWYLDYKCLLGDPADNLSGVLGYGKVKAARFVMARQPLASLPTEQFAIFALNRQLMMLPKTVAQLKTSPMSQQAVDICLTRLIDDFTHNTLPLTDMDKAQALLDKYECRSLNVKEYVNHGSR